MHLRYLRFIPSLVLTIGIGGPALAFDSREELQKIVQTAMPDGLVLTQVEDRFRHNANCIAYYSLRAIERGNQLVDDDKYAPPAKRYYDANVELSEKNLYGKWQSSGYVLTRQKQLAQAILNRNFDTVLDADQLVNGCSFKFRNRPATHSKPSLEIFE